MEQELKEKIKKIIAEITVPECRPRENSEYHIGFNSARIGYAEEKMKAMLLIENL